MATPTELLPSLSRARVAVQAFENSTAFHGSSGTSVRTLTLVTTGLAGQPDGNTIRLMEQRDEYPRVHLYEDELHSDILDEKAVYRAPRLWRSVYSRLPAAIAQVCEAYRSRRQYDAVISWSPRLSLLLALLLKLTKSRTPHIALMSWISAPKKAKLLKRVHSHIDRIVVWSSVQRKFAVETLGIPSGKVVLVHRRADHHFWRPMECPTDMISSAGQEMRDFPTLIEALTGLDIPCHIATGNLQGRTFATVEALNRIKVLPPNITVGKMEYLDLRKLYARSRFIVVPLFESDTDNGATLIEEAMAMGKAVICSRTRGQIDIVKEGETGLFVPPGNPEALRGAILYLWNNPSVAEEMGKTARKEIECHHTIDQFVADIKRIVAQVVSESPSARERVADSPRAALS